MDNSFIKNLEETMKPYWEAKKRRQDELISKIKSQKEIFLILSEGWMEYKDQNSLDDPTFEAYIEWIHRTLKI